MLWLCSVASIPTSNSTEVKENEQIKQNPEIVETKRIEVSTQQLMDAIVKENPGWDKNTSDTTLNITYDEAQMLMRIASAEAGNQGIHGMYLVMRVVINRVLDDDFPDSIKGVIFQKGQFETISKGTYYTTEIPVQAHLALAELEKNVNAEKRIIAFETKTNGNALTKYFTPLYEEGGHEFYGTKRH